MTFREVKEKFENKDAWGQIDNCEISDHTRWSRIKIFDEIFMALEILTGYDEYKPRIGFVPTEKWRLKQLYRADQEGRLREVSKTEALEIIKEAKRRIEK